MRHRNALSRANSRNDRVTIRELGIALSTSFFRRFLERCDHRGGRAVHPSPPRLHPHHTATCTSVYFSAKSIHQRQPRCRALDVLAMERAGVKGRQRPPRSRDDKCPTDRRNTSRIVTIGSCSSIISSSGSRLAAYGTSVASMPLTCSRSRTRCASPGEPGARYLMR